MIRSKDLFNSIKYSSILLILLIIVSCNKENQKRDYLVNEALQNQFDQDQNKNYQKINNTIEYKIYDEFKKDSVDVKEDVFVEKDSIFSTNRKFYYDVLYLHSSDTISKGDLSIKVTGQRWSFDDKQREILYRYEGSGWSKEKIASFHKKHKYPIHKNWVKFSNTGVIETTHKVWMHPPRSNEFRWLELTPFPEVQMPLKEGKKWSSTISTHEGWGSFSNKNIFSSYSIDKKTNYQVNNKNYESYLINASSKVDDLVFESKFVFSKEVGFLAFNYHSPYDEDLTIKLTDVIDE